MRNSSGYTFVKSFLQPMIDHLWLDLYGKNISNKMLGNKEFDTLKNKILAHFELPSVEALNNYAMDKGEWMGKIEEHSEIYNFMNGMLEYTRFFYYVIPFSIVYRPEVIYALYKAAKLGFTFEKEDILRLSQEFEKMDEFGTSHGYNFENSIAIAWDFVIRENNENVLFNRHENIFNHFMMPTYSSANVNHSLTQALQHFLKTKKHTTFLEMENTIGCPVASGQSIDAYDNALPMDYYIRGLSLFPSNSSLTNDVSEPTISYLLKEKIIFQDAVNPYHYFLDYEVFFEKIFQEDIFIGDSIFYLPEKPVETLVKIKSGSNSVAKFDPDFVSAAIRISNNIPEEGFYFCEQSLTSKFNQNISHMADIAVLYVLKMFDNLSIGKNSIDYENVFSFYQQLPDIARKVFLRTQLTMFYHIICNKSIDKHVLDKIDCSESGMDDFRLVFALLFNEAPILFTKIEMGSSVLLEIDEVIQKVRLNDFLKFISHGKFSTFNEFYQEFEQLRLLMGFTKNDFQDYEPNQRSLEMATHLLKANPDCAFNSGAISIEL